MGIEFAIAGLAPIEVEHLLLDLNGTVAEYGTIVGGVQDRVARIASLVSVTLLSADTLGTGKATADSLGIGYTFALDGAGKLAVGRELGLHRTAAIGNGTNDAQLLGAAAIGIAVVGPEGASREALSSAPIVCASITSALDLLLRPAAINATLRS